MTLTFTVASQDAAMAHSNPHQHARRNTVRSIVLDHGKKLKAKRATQAQQEAAARSSAWMANYAKQNKAWQEAAMADLKAGKTPQDFDTWSKSHGGSTGSGSGSSSSSAASKSSSSSAVKATATSTTKENATTSKSDDDDDDDEDDDEDDDDEDDDDDSSSSTSYKPTSTSTKHHASSTHHSSSSTSSSASATSTSSGSSGSGLLSDIIDVVTGTVTYYNTGLGACGWTNTDSDYIVALPVGVWNELGGSVSNGNVVCGHKLKVSNGQKAITVEITDQCPSCADTHLDLSPAAFQALGAEEKGVLNVSWGWVGEKPSKDD